MQSFKSFLSEAVTPAMLDKVDFLIRKYIKKKTSLALFRYPGAEEYKNAKERGFGLRYFFPKKNYSVRFNWKQAAAMGHGNLMSVTFWNGREEKPFVIEFAHPVSIIKVLPMLIDIIKTGRVTETSFYTLPDGIGLEEDVISEEVLTEATFGIPEIYDGVIDLIQQPNFAKGKVYSLYKGVGFKIFDELERRYPHLITKAGTTYVWNGKAKDVKTLQKDKQNILNAIGAVEASVKRGSEKETYKENPGVTAIENDMERLSFEMQLKDMENLLKLTVSGSSNSLFVGGRGGVGKTHGVEKTLASMGLVDGKGYFKNTGSVSAAGLYALLFRYKNDVLLFDDSDDVFGDQEARNVLKAATDTKRVRKLVWNKMGKNIVDPEGDMSDDEILDAGLIPRYFEYTGRIIFISNLPLNKLDPDGALRTRGFLIDINPTDAEIFDFMEKIAPSMPLEEGLKLTLADRKHVVDLLRKTTVKQPPSLRKLSRGLNMYGGAIAAGVEVSDEELRRMIMQYA